VARTRLSRFALQPLRIGAAVTELNEMARTADAAYRFGDATATFTPSVPCPLAARAGQCPDPLHEPASGADPIVALPPCID